MLFKAPTFIFTAFLLVAPALGLVAPMVRLASNTSTLISNATCAPDAQGGIQPSCWQSLEISQYIRDWYKANSTAANCDTLGFAQCYMQHSGFATMGCSTISVATCTPPATRGIDYDSQQQFYVLYTIYAMYQFFLSYSQALSAAQPLAAGYVGSIVQLVDPPSSTNADSREISLILASALAVFAVSAEFFAGNFKILLKTIFALTGQAGALNLLLNQKDTNLLGQLILLSELSEKLSAVVSDFQDRWNTLLETWTNDVELFVQVCENGGFTQTITKSTVDQSSSLLKDLTLYVYSSAMAAKGIFSSKNVNTDPRQIAAQSSQVNCPGLDKYGGCNGFYFDNATTTTYALNSNNDPGNAWTDQLWTAADKNWFTIEDLFVGANDCGEGLMSFDTETGKLSCASSLFTCTYRNDPADGGGQATIQFTDCPTQPHWLDAGVGTQSCVPYSYLGPYIQNNEVCIGKGE